MPNSNGGAHNIISMRSETRAKLVTSITRGRRWLEEIVAGTMTDVAQIAAREQCSVRHVNMSISLAFLAPDLVRAAIEARLPRGLGVVRLSHGAPEWSRQHRTLGLPSPEV
jgi:site-specific DNA recombinase